MNKNIYRIIFYSFSALLALYLFFNIIPDILDTSNIDVETVSEYTYSNAVLGYGMSIKSENIICANKDFTYADYNVENGHRISKNSVIANCIQNSLSDDDFSKITYVKRKINQLNSTFESDILISAYDLDSSAKSQIIDYLNFVDNNDLENAFNINDKIQIIFNRKNIKLNDSEFYKDVLSNYNTELSEIYKSDSISKFDVSTPQAGYFYSGFDGYENVKLEDYIQNDMVSNDIFNTLMDLKQESLPYNYVGKIQDSPTWYFIAQFDENALNGMDEGSNLKVEFNIKDNGRKILPFKLISKSDSRDGKIVVLMSCDILTTYEFQIRKSDCKLITDTYTGMKISNEALRVVDGQQGVYVLTGEEIVFKPVNIIYGTDDFSIVSAMETAGNRILKENDEVVVIGKDLFDGKVVNVK